MLSSYKIKQITDKEDLNSIIYRPLRVDKNSSINKFFNIEQLVCNYTIKYNGSMGLGVKNNKKHEKELLIEESIDIYQSLLPSVNNKCQLETNLKEILTDDMEERDINYKIYILKDNYNNILISFKCAIEMDSIIIKKIIYNLDLNAELSYELIYEALSLLISQNIGSNIYIEQICINKNEQFISVIENIGGNCITTDEGEYYNIELISKNIINIKTENFMSQLKELNLEEHKKYFEFCEKFNIKTEDYIFLSEGFGIFIENEDKVFLGGTYCTINKKTLSTELLWFHEDIRSRKLSKKLITCSEELAIEMGCENATVDTLSIYSPWLYTKLGYKEVNQMPIGGGVISFLYKKSLTA